MNVLWWPGRDTPAEVEIGGTWLATDAQRTPLNTEAKLLLLSRAFDDWHVFRVAVMTDERNERSRAAIERLGAVFEGVLRNHRPSTGFLGHPGRPRDTAAYSIIQSEWPDVRHRLQARLGGGRDA
jgi:RimJ/RimL family protein N-acetyltransferase